MPIVAIPVPCRAAIYAASADCQTAVSTFGEATLAHLPRVLLRMVTTREERSCALSRPVGSAIVFELQRGSARW